MKTKTNHYYIGIDLGDKSHEVCVLDHTGEIKKQRKTGNDRPALKELSEHYPDATVIMECGAHSPWTSRYLESLGMEVLVASGRTYRLPTEKGKACFAVWNILLTLFRMQRKENERLDVN